MGPVHEVDHTRETIAILIPQPWTTGAELGSNGHPALVWVNVRARHNARGYNHFVRYAHKISAAERAEWMNMGWVNRFHD